ncbi:hypothetical protein L7F22_016316 [Adiantum nelumboides]|nr:hypothetical protein [Adiantum nelumboides]
MLGGRFSREHDVFIIFDPGSTHNFISLELATKLGMQDFEMGDAMKLEYQSATIIPGLPLIRSMAVIENGNLKGVVRDKALFAVNYPGYPASIPRAVDTLGGKEAILKARSSETNYMELRFRPEDPYAHPVFGELHGFSGLLLELSVEEDKEKGGQVLRGEITAKVDQLYEFGGLADYQYIAPVHAKLEKERKRR